MLKRKIENILCEWKNKDDKKPLIVKGARQVGKTESIRLFAKQNYLNYVEINFALQKKFHSIFDDGYEVDTIISATRDIANHSVSFPRISPDGKFLVCTIHKYGNFSIWHKDANLFILDLSNADNDVQGIKMKSLRAANSDETDSYHSWSSNSRWLVFSSRRDDGYYTRPYFTYIDKNGDAHKPFMLPQENPRKFYKERDLSYNIPEFMTSRVPVSRNDIYAATKNDSIQVTYRK